MIHEIVAIYDSKAELYSRPMYFQTLGLAMRTFADEINRKDKDNIYNIHPQDFSLQHLGTFEDDTGLIVPISARTILRGTDALYTEKSNGN